MYKEKVTWMRILIFSELFYPHGGGAELATWLYSKLLAEKGFEITVVTRQFPNEPYTELLKDKISIFRIPMKMMLGTRYDTLANIGIMAISFIRNLIKQNDVIYIPTNWYSAIPVARIHKKPVIVHVHNYSITCPTSLMYDFDEQCVKASSSKSFILHEIIERKRGGLWVAASSFMNEFLGKHYNRIAMHADALIFVSNAQMNLVVQRVPHIRKKSYAIYNPIPNDPLIRAENKGMGYFGGRSFVKGFSILIRALESLKHPINFEAYMAMTSEEHNTAKIGNGILVNFLPRLNRASFLGIMKKLSIVVVPSLCPEPLPYTLIESMLSGKLVVASRIGGIPEMVDQTSSGVELIEPGDYKEIADALASFLTLELEEANEIGIKNREHILRKFDNKITIESFVEILNRVASSSV
jgi:glycosyltransferase involved in cell wall biosynthesis